MTYCDDAITFAVCVLPLIHLRALTAVLLTLVRKAPKAFEITVPQRGGPERDPSFVIAKYHLPRRRQAQRDSKRWKGVVIMYLWVRCMAVEMLRRALEIRMSGTNC